MKLKIINPDAASFSAALGISIERKEELNDIINKSIREGISSLDSVVEAVNQTNTDEESTYVTYQLGRIAMEAESGRLQGIGTIPFEHYKNTHS